MLQPGLYRAELRSRLQAGVAIPRHSGRRRPSPNACGEVVFELDEGQAYVLHPLGREGSGTVA